MRQVHFALTELGLFCHRVPGRCPGLFHLAPSGLKTRTHSAAKKPGWKDAIDKAMQDITNELWRDGTEAVAVNGQRLTATSTIRAAGGAILVDFRPVTGPYQVAAIGPDDLAKRFGDSPTAHRFRRYVDLYGMQFAVGRRQALTLPAAAEPQLRYARTPQTGPSGTPVPSASGGGR